jgi:hypothetical protein
MNIQMELRKCCNHPFLVRGVEDHEIDAMLTAMLAADKLAGGDSAAPQDEEQVSLYTYIAGVCTCA